MVKIFVFLNKFP